MPEAPCCDDLGHNAGQMNPPPSSVSAGRAAVGVRGRRWRFFTGRMFLPADFILASFKQTAPTNALPGPALLERLLCTSVTEPGEC